MLRSVDLDALNSATKYPSIPTFHPLDSSNGSLLDEPTAFADEDAQVVLTEKVDGTNSRIITFPSGEYVIGSREELLYAKGDLLGNPALGIAAALRPLADRLTPPAGGVRVLFLEVYGGKVGGAARQYSGHRTVGHRLFDAADIPAETLTWPRPRISAWREEGGQAFLGEAELAALADTETVPLVPRIGALESADLPTRLDETREFLTRHLPTTRVALDDEAGGRPEGIVVRTTTRSVIAKARFQDYERTLKRRASKEKRG
ncbi:RNA ligase family protein [Actinomadura xylanilytica]|uniref:RNA ligase family protein n=1 Tax=Actinomadura xylanilytica TaxID=887459 RepID=UPI00255B2479|nr:RNA ligase family protein [Actinomadura xylanilytica]MDL4773049.1 RNA ligase family protein [Actinomadura xylanilytica]